MKIFHWKSKTTYIVVSVFVIVFLVGLVRNCQAAEYNLDGGYGLASFADNCPGAAVGEASLLAYNRHLDISLGMVGDQCKSAAEGSSSSFGYLSVQGVVQPFGPYFLGLGASIHSNISGTYELLPETVNFSLSAGVDWKHWRLEFRHFSNAGINDSNRGQNHILAGYIF